VTVRLLECAHCGCQESRPVLSSVDRLYGNTGVFTLIGCSRCGLIRLFPFPTPEESASYYPSEYKEYVAPPRLDSNPVRRLLRTHGLQRRYRSVIGSRSPGRLLDVGCATGVFLDFAKRRGWTVEGVEPGAAAAYATQVLGLNVHQCDLRSAGLPSGSYDVITMWNVIEHLQDPLADLREARRLLKPDGLLVVATPNAASIDRRLFGSDWAFWELPRHNWIFDRHTLADAFARAGFRGRESRCHFGAWYSFATSFQYRTTRILGVAMNPGHLWENSLVAQIPRALLVPYLSLVDRLYLGPMMVFLGDPC
jgi:SAM-dependent methyltransferase